MTGAELRGTTSWALEVAAARNRRAEASLRMRRNLLLHLRPMRNAILSAKIDVRTSKLESRSSKIEVRTPTQPCPTMSLQRRAGDRRNNGLNPRQRYCSLPHPGGIRSRRGQTRSEV